MLTGCPGWLETLSGRGQGNIATPAAMRPGGRCGPNNTACPPLLPLQGIQAVDSTQEALARLDVASIEQQLADQERALPAAALDGPLQARMRAESTPGGAMQLLQPGEEQVGGKGGIAATTARSLIACITAHPSHASCHAARHGHCQPRPAPPALQGLPLRWFSTVNSEYAGSPDGAHTRKGGAAADAAAAAGQAALAAPAFDREPGAREGAGWEAGGQLPRVGSPFLASASPLGRLAAVLAQKKTAIQVGQARLVGARGGRGGGG